MQIDFLGIQAFLAVAESGSFAMAAARFDFIPREELPWVMGRGLSRLLRWAEPDR